MKAAGIRYEKRRPPSVGRRRPRGLVAKARSRVFSIDGCVNDAVGRRTSMSRSGSAYTTSDTISYTYNDRSELTGAQSNVDTAYSYSYAYDSIGNRITASEAGVPWTYTTNNLNQYTTATENNMQLNFSYDLDGSMTYRPVDATSGWTQVWNGENRMVETFKGSDRLTFKYDYMGRRVEKCVYNGNTLASRTLFVYDGFKCVEELDGLNNNTVLMRHTWQPFDVGLDVIFASTDVNGTSYFLHDANKNVMQNINSDGSLLENYIYAPFGNNVGTYNIPNIGFSSEITEKTLGISYYNYRYYLLSLGRWNKRDPIEEKSSNNLYLFINNSINNKFDHLGQVNIVFGPDENVSPNDLCCLEYMDMWMFEGYASESDCLSKCASSYYAGQLSTSVISLALGICSSSPNPVTTKTCAILGTFIGGYSVGITIGCIIACEMNICRSYSPPEKYNYIGRNWYFKKVCKTRYRCPAYRDLRD